MCRTSGTTGNRNNTNPRSLLRGFILYIFWKIFLAGLAQCQWAGCIGLKFLPGVKQADGDAAGVWSADRGRGYAWYSFFVDHKIPDRLQRCVPLIAWYFSLLYNISYHIVNIQNKQESRAAATFFLYSIKTSFSNFLTNCSILRNSQCCDLLFNIKDLPQNAAGQNIIFRPVPAQADGSAQAAQG